MSEQTMKCPKCGTEMEKCGKAIDKDETGEFWDIVFILYQCPKCKTVRLVEED